MAKVCLCGCGNPVFSNKYAKYCQYKRTDDKWIRAQEKKAEKIKSKPKTINRSYNNIKPISDKKAEELKIYRVKRDAYLKEITECEVRECNKKSTHIHHMNGRIGKNLYDDNMFMAVCNSCHPSKIHENPKWAREQGYLI